MPVQRGGGGHGGADEVGAPARALAAFKVAVAGGGAALARLQAVGVHGQAHAASGFAPLEARFGEHFVQPFGFGLPFDQAGAGHNHRQLDVGRELAAQAADDGGGFAHVFNAAVGAAADEDFVDGDVAQRLAGRQTHVGKRALDGAAPRDVGFLRGVGHAAVYAQHHFGAGAPGDLRDDLRGVQLHHGVKVRAGVGVQGAPVGHGLLPFGAARELAGGRVGAGGQQAALEVVDGFFVHGHQPGARARFNGHVAHGHAPFHAQGADGAARKFDGVARAACGADLADDGQHDVFGGDAGGGLAFHADEHVFGLFGQQRLRGHDVLDFAGADAVRQRAECAVGAGVAVAANHGHARQRGAVFGADDVHDALALAQEGKVGRRAAGAHVGVQRHDLLAADGVFNAGQALFPAGGGRVVVGSGDDGADAPHLAPRLAQALEGLRAGDFVYQVAIDVEDGGAVFFGGDDVLVPELVIQGAGGGVGHGFSFSCVSKKRGKQRLEGKA